VPTKVGKGNTRIPTLKIVKWVARPSELQAEAVSSPSISAQPDDIEDEF
jgi:hypothetical protein